MNKGQKVAVGVVLGVPLVCCLGGVLTVRNGLANASGTLEGDLRTLKQRGFPTEPADLKSKVPVSEAQNAAPLYAKAAKILDDGTPEYGLMKEVGKGLSPKATEGDRALAAQSFAKLSNVVALAEQAADRPGCDFKRDWNKGYTLEFPEYRGMKDLTRLLAFKAEGQSAAGDWRGALRSLTRAQKIAQHAEADGILIGCLVHIANETIVHRSLRNVANENGRNPAFVAAARKTLDGFGPLPDMRRAMGTELVFGRSCIRSINSTDDITKMSEGMGEESSGSSRSPLSGLPLGMLRGAFEARLVNEYVRMEAALPKDPEQWEKAKDALVAVDKRTEADKSPLNVMNAILMPVGVQSAEAVGKLSAERRVTEGALRILQARGRGSAPSALPADLKKMKDPFGRGPLGYRPDGRRFLIYSVGPDRTDNGGLARSGSSNSFDIVADFD